MLWELLNWVFGEWLSGCGKLRVQQGRQVVSGWHSQSFPRRSREHPARSNIALSTMTWHFLHRERTQPQCQAPLKKRIVLLIFDSLTLWFVGGRAQASTWLMTRQPEICQFHFDIFWLSLSPNRMQNTLWRCMTMQSHFLPEEFS